MLRLVKKQEHGFSYPVLSDILPFYSFYDIPLSQILLDKNFFNTIDNIDLFLKAEESDGILDFLSEHRAASAVTLAALRLRTMAEEVKEDLANLLEGDETAIEGNQVARANRHFDEKVAPYFRERFLAYSPTQGVMECVENIEKEIRIMILNVIRERSEKEKNKEMNAFIEEHFQALSEGETGAMKASYADMRGARGLACV